MKELQRVTGLILGKEYDKAERELEAAIEFGLITGQRLINPLAVKELKEAITIGRIGEL